MPMDYIFRELQNVLVIGAILAGISTLLLDFVLALEF